MPFDEHMFQVCTLCCALQPPGSMSQMPMDAMPPPMPAPAIGLGSHLQAAASGSLPDTMQSMPVPQHADMSLLPIPDALRTNYHGELGLCCCGRFCQCDGLQLYLNHCYKTPFQLLPLLILCAAHGEEYENDGEQDDQEQDGSQYEDAGPSQGQDAEQRVPDTPNMRRLREHESAPLESPSKRLDALAGRSSRLWRQYCAGALLQCSS